MREFDSYIELMWRFNRGLTSTLIAWDGQGWIGDGWSHVDGVTPWGLAGARYDYVGGKPPGFEIRPFNYETPLRSRVLRIPCTLIQRAQWLDATEDLVGTKYDSRGILDIIFGRKPVNDKRYFCSAGQAHLQEISGILPKGLNGVLARQVTPNALYLADTGRGGAIVQHPRTKLGVLLPA